MGMADGLTVPFALAAGLSAVSSAAVVVTAGVAEIVAGAVSMGLGGYLAARGDEEHYQQERLREQQEVRDVPGEEMAEVSQVFEGYGLSRAEIKPILHTLRRQPEAWVDFMMRFELGLEKPTEGRALRSAATIAVSYAAGGLVPLVPYIVSGNLHQAVGWSVVCTLTALLLFGYAKGRIIGRHPWRSAVQTALVGGLAAAAAWFLARLVGSAS